MDTPLHYPAVTTHHSPPAMHWTSIVGLIFVTTVWGAGFSAIKIGLGYLPPFLFVGFRFLVVSMILGLVMKGRGTAFRVPRAHWREMAALVFLFYAQQGLLFVGMQHTHAGRTGVILNSQPLMTALLAHFFVSKDRLSTPKILGALIGFGGVTVVFGDRLGPLSPMALRGDLLILAAALGWAAANIITKRLEGKVAPSTIVVWCAFGSSLAFLLTSGLRHESVLKLPDARFWIAVTYLVLIATTYSFVLWNRLIQRNLPSLATSFCFLTPVASVFFGWLILEEPLTSGMLLGTVLVAAGIVLANLFGANGEGVPTRLRQERADR
ncbi:MAG: DMT family transporter [Armatimonadetes bacterium]|nr:DMT family transporter [Armatimonadota bacterium]